MRLLQINDIHLSDQPPAMRTASYTDDVLDKVHAAMLIASEQRVDVVVFTGDVFHRKNAAHTTHRTVQQLRGILLDFGIPVRIVPGNHDEAHGGGLEGQPLLSLPGDEVQLLYGDDPDWPICGIPWNNRMEGPGGAEYIAGKINACRAPLVFTHAPLTVHPWPFGSEARGWVEIAALTPLLRDSVRLVAHGHMHNGHDCGFDRQPRVPWVMYSNPGALARATIGHDDAGREPMVALINYDARGAEHVAVEYHAVPHRPAAEVYRVAERAADVARASGIAALSAALTGASTHVVTPESLVLLLRGLARPDGIADDVWEQGVALAERSIEEAGA